MSRTLFGLVLTLTLAIALPAVSQEVPADDEIKSAITAYWNEGNIKRIAALQNQIRSAVTEAEKSRYEARAKAAPSKCPSDPCIKCPEKVRDNPICFQKREDESFFKQIWVGPDSLAKCTREVRDSCLAEESRDWKSTIEKIRQRNDEIRDLASGPTSAQARTDNQVFSVVKKNNYEGNVICYVNLRTKGTDNIGQIKVTMQNKAGQWLVVNYEDLKR